MNLVSDYITLTMTEEKASDTALNREENQLSSAIPALVRGRKDLILPIFKTVSALKPTVRNMAFHCFLAG